MADDAEFVRRVYLDLTGVIPRVSEVREFLHDTSPNKRAQLVDRLSHPTGTLVALAVGRVTAGAHRSRFHSEHLVARRQNQMVRVAGDTLGQAEPGEGRHVGAGREEPLVDRVVQLHCVVVEEGVYTKQSHGVTMEASKYQSTTT